VSDVDPPATAVWYDLDATTAEVLAILRLTEQDVDTARIVELVPAAATLIDEYLDGTEAVSGPPPAPKLQTALNKVTEDLYRRKDTTAVFIQSLPHVLDPVRSELAGSKQRWGIS
jgi:hypothetical protein